MFRFENLEIWKEALIFCNHVYDLTERFPRDERFGLVDQLHRSSVSISANIAEGSASESTKEFKMFLNYSIRSTAEVVSEMFIAKDRKFIPVEPFNKIYSEADLLIRRISSFRKSLK